MLGRNKRYKFKPYTGRRQFSLPLAVIVFLLIAAVCFVFLFNLSNIVALFKGPETTQEPPPQKIEQQQEDNATDNAEQPEKPQEGEKNINALYVPKEYTQDEESLLSFCNQAKEAGANSLVIDIKQDDGIVLFNMGLAYSFLADITRENAMDINEVVSLLKDEGFALTARISCFKDNAAPRKSVAMAVTTNGVTWLDWNYVSFIDPYSQLGTEYLSDLALFASNAGFDNIVLYNVNFPVKGKINLIDYTAQENSSDQKQKTINQFLQDVGSRLTGNSSLCLEMSAAEFAFGADERTGLALQNAIPYIDAVSPHIFPSEIIDEKGNSFTMGDNTINDPVSSPGGLTGAMCDRFHALADGTDTQFMPFLQGYIVSSDAYAAYDGDKIAEQINTLADRGFDDYCIYNPGGSYQIGLIQK